MENIFFDIRVSILFLVGWYIRINGEFVGGGEYVGGGEIVESCAVDVRKVIGNGVRKGICIQFDNSHSNRKMYMK